MQVNALVLSYLASAMIAGAVGVAAWRQQPFPATRILALLMAAVTWWLLANVLEAASIDLEAKVAWSVVAYPGIVCVPVLFLVFALRWTHQDRWLTRSRIALLFAVPAASVLMAATNPWHHLLWPAVTLVDAWGVSAVYAHGPWFWVEVAYGYAVAALGFGALVVAVRRHPGFYSRRVRAAMIASCVPVVASACYAAGLDAGAHADLSSIAFALTSLVAGFAILQSRVLDPIPIAWAALVDRLPDAVLVLGPEGRLAASNPSATRLLGVALTAVGGTVAEVLATLPELARATAATSDTECEISCEDGRWLNVRLNVIEDGRGRDLGRIVVVRDVTERRRMVETIRQLSLTDELTGLLNRRGFMALAEQQVRSAMRSRGRFWLLFADVDGLKETNDRFGHDAGDDVLREVAETLRQAVFRDSDIVARFGGDEFVVLAPETGSASGAALIDRVETAMDRRRAGVDRRRSISLSVGAAEFDPAHPVSIDELIREADRGMYLRKRDHHGADDLRPPEIEAAS